MDLGSGLSPLLVLIYWLFPTPPMCRSDEIRCSCPEIPAVDLTESPPRDCFEVGARYRYRCKEGYKREAGTSDLIRCVQAAHAVEWTSPNLRCKFLPTRSFGEPSSPPPAATGESNTAPAATSAAAPARGDTEAPRNSSRDSHVSDHHLSSTHIASLCFVPVFVCVLVGMIYFCYKRRTSDVTQPLPAERMPMNSPPPEADQ